MIKKIYIAFMFAGSMLMSSCDNFLDVQPVGKVIPNSLEEYRALLTTAYSISFTDRSVCDMRTGDIMVRNDEYDQNNYSDIERWLDTNLKPSTTEFKWADYYSNIFYANSIISKKEEITEGSKEDIDQLVGEAYLMRGYLHFILVNLYGEPYTKAGAVDSKAVPLKLNIDLEDIPSRNTVGELYASILSDIQDARKLLNREEWESIYKYRFSTLSVDAFESRVYLYMGEWQNAYDAAERILKKKSALENYNSTDFKLPNQFQSVEMITAYESIYNSSALNASQVTPTFYQLFDATNDLRIGKYFGSANTNGNYPIKKTDGKSEYKCTFRTGELYLNSAEAAARLNKLPEARTRLLELMEKRYTPEGYAQKKTVVEGMSQTLLITEILAERARELAFEGHRWFDLRRTTRPRIEKVFDGTTLVLEQDDPRYTLRIPQSAITSNPGLLN